MKAVYPVIVTPISNGKYMAETPDLPTCVTSGRSIQEALDNAREALHGCLCVLEDDNQSLPQPSAPESIEHEGGTALALISVDTVQHRREHDQRAVRKNVSMPAWMAERADRLNLNLSQIIQDSLRVAFAQTQN